MLIKNRNKCPKCGFKNLTVSDVTVWHGCKRCRFGELEYAMSNGNPHMWAQLMAKRLEKLEIERLCNEE